MNQNLFNALDNMGYILLEYELEAVVEAVMKDHPKYERAVKIVNSLANVSHVAFPKQNFHITDLVTKAHNFVKDYPE